MPTIVVGGAARNVGKTSLICGIVAALSERPWTAVKITSHDHGKQTPIWEETQAGQGTDTARYLAAGARRALLVTTRDGKVPIAELGAVLVDDRWLIFETNQVQSLQKGDVVLVLIGSEETESKPSFTAVVRCADAFVYEARSAPSPTPQDGMGPSFVLPDLLHITPELQQWLRTQLGLSGPER